MRVLVCPADETGCGHHRILAPAAILKQADATIEIDRAIDLPIIHRARGGDVVGVLDPDCDVLVLQRPIHDWMADSIPYFQRKGVRIVVDIDDHFHALDPSNSFYREYHPIRNRRSNWHHLARACALADLVTVTTEPLARRYGAHGRVMIVPNYVSRGLLDVPRADDGRTVGWTGQAANHPSDLQVTRGGVAQAVEETGSRFLNVGTGEGIELKLGLRAPADVTGWVSLPRYYQELSRFTVGVAPLADSQFNRAKSNLKALEMAALGVPFVASPRAEYVKLGLGLFAADKAKEWRREIKRLLADEALRSELAEQGREVVREQHTLEANAWRFAEAWLEPARV